jgi:hypothetical protein
VISRVSANESALPMQNFFHHHISLNLMILTFSSWRERNDRCFEDRERTLEKIKSLFFNTLHLWTAAYVSHLVISFHDFLFLF